MALISRLFQSRKNQRHPASRGRPKTVGSTEWKAPEFERSQIRLVVFKNHEVRGRNILFDSKAIKRIEENQDVSVNKKGACHIRDHSNISAPKRDLPPRSPLDSSGSPKTPGKFQYMRVGNDTKLLGEMIFGSVAMSYKGSSLKVHSIRCPPQLMFTSVFEPNAKNRGSSCEMENYDSNSLHSSLGDLTPAKQIYCRERTGSGTTTMASSVPVEIPTSSGLSHADTEDSGLCTSFASSGSFTPFPSPGSSSSINSNSYNSLHRRWMRSHQTCLEYGVRRRAEREDGNLLSEPTPAWKRQSTIGMAILIDLFGENEAEKNRHFQNFFFSHITLFEAHVEKLQHGLEKAFTNKKDFIHIVMETLDRFRNEICDLYTAPRLTEPVWLNMMSYSHNRQNICHQFMKEFMEAAEKYETKNTNFFMSTLVTAVLTYHLAWIPTVTPAGAIPSRTYLDKHSAKWLDTLTKSHPYNPLWAQLSDLYGAIGYPLKIARTVVVGKKRDLIGKLLYILSYFIRCSEVYENLECCDEITDDELEVLDVAMDKCLTRESTLVSGDRDRNVPAFLKESYNVKSRDGRTIGFVDDIGSSRCQKCHKESSNFGSTKRSVNCECPKLCDSCEMPQGNHASVCSKSSDTSNKSNGSDRTFICDETSDSTYQIVYDDGKAQMGVSLSNTGPYDKSHSEQDITESEIKIENEIQECKLSARNPLQVSVEDVRHVGRASPADVLVGKDYDKSLPQIYSYSINNSDSPTKKYMRLPSKDEAVASELDEYFDEQTLVGTIDDVQVTRGPRSDGFGTNNDTHDEPLHYGNPLESITDSQYSSGRFSLCSSTSQRCRQDSEQADSLFADSINVEESSLPQTWHIPRADTHIHDYDTHGDQSTLTSDVCTESVSNPPPSKTDTEGIRSVNICDSPTKVMRTRSRNNSGEKQFSRQTSRSSTPGRCRSVTPTELGRRRHTSSASTTESEAFDPFLDLKELPMPRSDEDSEESNVKTFERNFGRSLLAGYSDHYLSDFVLHGTSDNQYLGKLISDLDLAGQTTILDEPLTEAVCLVADADNWEVRLMSSQRVPMQDKTAGMTMCTSQLVANLVESVHDLWKLKMSPDFCLMHLEDRLQEIYFKSRMMAEFMRHHNKVDVKELTSVLGCDSSDVPLLMAVAGTHSPQLSFGLL